MAEARDGSGNYSGVIYGYVLITASHNPTVSFNAPASVSPNQSYMVRADGNDVDGNLNAVHIDREGVPFAYGFIGNGYGAYTQNPDSSAGRSSPTTYMAQAFDTYGNTSGVVYHTVSIANNGPATWWSPDSVGTVYINAPYGSTARASDSDGNLKELRIYRTIYEYLPGGGVNSGGPELVQTEPTQDGGHTAVVTGSWTAAKPYICKYVWSAISEDTLGAMSPIVSVSGGDITTVNRPPVSPTLVSTHTTIGLGQSVVISSYINDYDSNLTGHWLWYQPPSLIGTSQWVSLNNWEYADGIGGGTVNYTFTPTEIGAYKFKVRSNDPYESTVDVEVQIAVEDRIPPNPQTNLQITLAMPNYVNLTWTISTSDDVAQQLVHWQQMPGGGLTDLVLGINMAGASVTGLSPGQSYRFYLTAKDGAGNESSPSNEVTATLPLSADDLDNDGVPNAVETLLGTNPQSKGVNDSGNTTIRQNVHKPTATP